MNDLFFKYSICTDGPIKTSTIVLKIPDFQTFLTSNTAIQIRTKKCDDSKDAPDDSSNLRFLIKMHFQRRENDVIDLYYQSLDSVVLKSVLTMCNRTLVENKYNTIETYKWQYLATLYKKDLTKSKYDMMRYNDYESDSYSLQLKFTFMVMACNNMKVDTMNVSRVLSNDFEYLLNNKLFTDVIIISAENIEFRVHKAVLASRSAVLKSYFDHNTTECSTNVVKSPFETKVLREVIAFMYSDKASQLDEMPEHLLAAADYYQLSRLKSLCEEALHKKLTVNNAIATLELADLYSAETLKKLTLEFIKDGQAGLITGTDDWEKFNSVKLIKMIYKYVVADDLKVEKIKYYNVVNE